LRDSSKVGQLAKSDRQLRRPTKLSDKVAQLCCVSDIGLSLCFTLPVAQPTASKQ